MNQTTAIALAGKNICSQIATLERMLPNIQAQPAHGYVGVMAFQAGVFQDGLNVLDEADLSGNSGRQLGNIHGLRKHHRARYQHQPTKAENRYPRSVIPYSPHARTEIHREMARKEQDQIEKRENFIKK